MKPGDKVMLVSQDGFRRRLHISVDRVKSVHKNGNIVLERSDGMYRANGTKTGRHGYSSPPRLQAWDDALWQEFQRVQSNAAMASKLYRLSDIIQRTHDDDAAAAIWEQLPYSVQKLVEDAQEQPR